VSRDQGITKAGPPMLRAQMLQMTWRWLHLQPDSELARWFRKRTDGASGRMRRVMAVALARKLQVALWRHATTGTVPQEAVVI
jgi:transposase